MIDAWIALGRINADLLAMAARSVDLGYILLAAGAAWTSWEPPSRSTDLKALGLDRIPASRAELRSAYRRAVKAAHPDVGGSEDAFRTVVEAFGRLAHTHPWAA
jgi:hypothetical protein